MQHLDGKEYTVNGNACTSGPQHDMFVCMFVCFILHGMALLQTRGICQSKIIAIALNLPSKIQLEHIRK